MYPGKPDGTNTERIANAITTEVIERSDYLIDLHCGDGNEALLPYAYWMTLDDEKLNEQAKQLVLACLYLQHCHDAQQASHHH